MDDALHWAGTGSAADEADSLAERPAAAEDPDAALVARARADPARFLALYERHFARVHRYVRLRLPDRASAEDVTSEVFLTALAKLAEFRGEGSFGAWLLRIAQNAARATRRARPPSTLDCEALELPDAAPGPEEQALSHERTDELRRLLASLKEDQQDLIALRYGAGLPYEEIAAVLGMSSGAARVAVHRLLSELRERYDHD